MGDLSPENATAVVAQASIPSPRETAMRLARSFAIYGIANFGIRGLSFLLVLVYTHYLRPSDYGIIYMSEIVATFLMIFGNLSIDSAFQRLYFQHDHDQEELRSYLGTSIRFGLSAMAILVVMTFLVGGSVQSHLTVTMGVPFYPYIAMAIVTGAATQGVQYRLAVYQSERRPRSYAVLALFVFLLTAGCCIYGVVVLHRGALGMLEGKLIAATLALIVAAWSMRNLLTARFEWSFVRESLSFSLPLLPHLVMASGLVVADRFILKHYRDLSEVGIYSLAYTFGMIMFLVTQSLSQAWLPMFFDLAGGHKENRQLLGRICSGLAIFLVSIACLGILLSPPFVHVVLDYRYHATASIVPLVIMGYLFHALFALFDISIMQAKRTGFVFLISLLAFSTNIVLNFVMIPRWGMHGAAWATTIAYGVEAMIAYIFAQHFFAIPYRLPEIFAAVAVSSTALWLTQSGWITKWHGLLPVFAVIPIFGILAVIGRRDLRVTLNAIQRARKRQPLATG